MFAPQAGLLPALLVFTCALLRPVAAYCRSGAHPPLFLAVVIPMFMAANLLPVTVDAAHYYPTVNTFVVCCTVNL